MQQVTDSPKKKNRQKIFLKSGVEFTPEVEAELVAEAERGYDLSKARRHLLTRPLLADSSSIPRITFPLSQEELNAARRRAEEEDRSVGDLVREALQRYLDS
jgi:hypothetical protein